MFNKPPASKNKSSSAEKSSPVTYTQNKHPDTFNPSRETPGFFIKDRNPSENSPENQKRDNGDKGSFQTGRNDGLYKSPENISPQRRDREERSIPRSDR